MDDIEPYERMQQALLAIQADCSDFAQAIAASETNAETPGVVVNRIYRHAVDGLGFPNPDAPEYERERQRGLHAAHAALRIAARVYGGVPGGHPATDADRLTALAAWIDSIDDLAEEARRATGLDDSIDREIQQDLRRIAAGLSDGRS